MAKIFGVNTKISGKVGQLLYRQTKRGTVVSELPVKPAIPRRSARQMDRRTQWGLPHMGNWTPLNKLNTVKNLAAIYKQFDSMLRRGFEELPPHMSVYNAFIQAYPVRGTEHRWNKSNTVRNLGVVKVYITKRMKLNGGAILAPYQLTRGSLPSISMAKNSSNKLVSSIALGSLSITATVGDWFLPREKINFVNPNKRAQGGFPVDTPPGENSMMVMRAWY